MTVEKLEEISARIDLLCKSPKHAGIGEITAGLKKMTAELKRLYEKANRSSRREAHEEWLCDNYYVIEKESKLSVKEIKKAAKNSRPHESENFYYIIKNIIKDFMPPINNENLIFIINEILKHSPVTETQYAFLPTALKCALINTAYDACITEKNAEKIAYAIISVGHIYSLEVEEIILECSKTEKLLLLDPAGIYAFMNEESRQYYRYLIAKIARRQNRREEDIAGDMLKLAGMESTSPKNHVGYWILGNKSITAPRRKRGRTAIAVQVILPLVLSLGFAWLLNNPVLALLFYLPLWEILRSLIWQYSLMGMDIDFLPRMELKRLRNKPKTVVLVSTLLPKPEQARDMEKRLEQLYFSNSDPDMYYCILADFKQGEYPADDRDQSQIEAVSRVINRLNAKYSDKFMLFLRRRSYNRVQKIYSGWERKRGAITEFVRFLKGEKTSAEVFIGDKTHFDEIKFIIALDADTSLLYESAQTLVSIALHPLNMPVWGEDKIVREGYGILAPKMSTDLNSAKYTAFSRVLCGCGGVTAYESRDKDFYQDLFSEGIFAGKGLIHVDCFYELLSDRFPENQVLSHDILEGAYMRCAFVSDVEMTDTSPSNMISWLSRLHRWIRGDWQNIRFLGSSYKSGGKNYENPINAVSRFKIFDNLRRSLAPVCSIVLIIYALFAGPVKASVITALIGALTMCFSSFWAALHAFFSEGLFALSRKFFTRTLPHTLELVAQGIVFLIMMPAQVIVVMDAVLRSLYRTFISKNRMLEWTTAAQGEEAKITALVIIKKLWPAELFAVLYMALAPNEYLQILAFLFMLTGFAAYYTAKPTPEDGHSIGAADKETLISYNAAMWRYYEKFADKENNFLPPDNVQQSPVFRVAARTSPTNIGLLLLACLAARDFNFIDTPGLYIRVERTIGVVERLPKLRGNLYNWYDNLTLETLKPEFVSSVDSGNFICCLVALKEGLLEFVKEYPKFKALAARIQKLIDECDLTVFYNEKKKLFSIGWDVEKGGLLDSHYDFLMSEARLTSYYAVARKIVGKKHWGQLGRTMSRSGSYAGPVSWTGTMFEYFMPHLLLPVYDGSLLNESLTYCLYCHKKRVKKKGVPWGISESAFYAFDNFLNYQYKAHGVQKVGVKRYLDDELVISPYSTFITIPFNPNSSMRNLKKLRKLGVYGRYGFFEAVDFTEKRVGKDSIAVIRSYMAHHIGMSMVASCNAVFENRMQKRFMRDNYMRSAKEFLEEKISKNTVIYDSLESKNDNMENAGKRKYPQQTGNISPENARCFIISNGELTDVLTDTGAGYLKFGDTDLTRRPADLLRDAQGFLAYVKNSVDILPITLAPGYDNSAKYYVKHSEREVAYHAEKNSISASMRCVIHPTISCAQRQVTVKNNSNKKERFSLLLYFEPTLSIFRDYSVHPAYSKLFVTGSYDDNTNTLTFKRRNRDSSEDMFLTAGFLRSEAFSFETRREEVMSAPDGLLGLPENLGRVFKGNDGGVPDACCAISLEKVINAGSEETVTLLISAGKTREEGLANIVSMRAQGLLQAEKAAVAPIAADSLEDRLSARMLGSLLFGSGNTHNSKARKENKLSQSALWVTGISGDVPIMLVENAAKEDSSLTQSYIKMLKSLKALSIEYDLVFLYKNSEEYAFISKCIEDTGAESLINIKGGIFLVDTGTTDKGVINLIRASAGYMPNGENGNAAEFVPVKFERIAPAEMPAVTTLKVEGGAFLEDKFYVDKKSPLPYTHILANSVFGTLLSDKALGFSWAVNSRENKLTPWFNDICADNKGEMCTLKIRDKYYDLVNGARAMFCGKMAEYSGGADGIKSSLKVTVPKKGAVKHMELVLTNTGTKDIECTCAYYTEPVLGVMRDTSMYICGEMAGRDVLVMHNPYNSAVKSFSAVTALTEDNTGPYFITDRTAFLSGKWDNPLLNSGSDICAAVLVPLKIKAGNSARIRFALSWGNDSISAARLVKCGIKEEAQKKNGIIIKTPDRHLNHFINYFAPHQILQSRIYGRCAFYQCGGAYGFRDQLQDVSAYLLIDPEIAYVQIIRCCAVQFTEGDVLHWWHDLPEEEGGLKGVRTRFSDDLVWLPFVLAEYVVKTGDKSILDEEVNYLEAEALKDTEHEKYISPSKSTIKESVYEHCMRALRRAYNVDENGLPYIGCGDWNDGFSSVGLEGRGTSVWLALFLSLTMRKFLNIAKLKKDMETCRELTAQSKALLEAVDKHAWDGGWYLRAFYDDGSPMGAAENSECSIDLLPQSFAVIAGMPDKERVNTAMANAYGRLVDEKLQIVKLFDKAFSTSHQQPGYVKAYPAGIRENGGQYTHSACWFAKALLENGETDKGYNIIRMLNPVYRASNPELSEAYKAEPYYIAADIYANGKAPAHAGWSMYTGAAAWYYRVVVEDLLGIKLRGDRLLIEPKIPESLSGSVVCLNIKGTALRVTINKGAGKGLVCDGKPVREIMLDGGEHDVVCGV